MPDCRTPSGGAPAASRSRRRRHATGAVGHDGLGAWMKFHPFAFMGCAALGICCRSLQRRCCLIATQHLAPLRLVQQQQQARGCMSHHRIRSADAAASLEPHIVAAYRAAAVHAPRGPLPVRWACRTAAGCLASLAARCVHALAASCSPPQPISPSMPTSTGGGLRLQRGRGRRAAGQRLRRAARRAGPARRGRQPAVLR